MRAEAGSEAECLTPCQTAKLPLRPFESPGGVLPGTFNGSRISIRELPTLASIFGSDNSAGLKSGTHATADLIYLYASGSFSKYYYFPGGFGQSAEWREFSSGANADATILPNKGSFFIDRQGVDISVMFTEDLPNN